MKKQLIFIGGLVLLILLLACDLGALSPTLKDKIYKNEIELERQYRVIEVEKKSSPLLQIPYYVVYVCDGNITLSFAIFDLNLKRGDTIVIHSIPPNGVIPPWRFVPQYTVEVVP